MMTTRICRILWKLWHACWSVKLVCDTFSRICFTIVLFLNYKLMSEALEKINLVDIRDILDRLWIQYRDNDILDEGQMTDGWKIHKKKNCVVNFTANKNRPTWWPFSVVKKTLKLTAKECFDWFADTFGIDCKSWKKQKISNKPWRRKYSRFDTI